MKDCPANWPFECTNCLYSKEGLCDWPYVNGMGVDEIRNVTRELKKGGDKEVVEKIKKIVKINEHPWELWIELPHPYEQHEHYMRGYNAAIRKILNSLKPC